MGSCYSTPCSPISRTTWTSFAVYQPSALEGTPEDWQSVARRAEQFGSLDLEWWLEPLRGILQQFVAASQGVVDVPFWQITLQVPRREWRPNNHRLDLDAIPLLEGPTHGIGNQSEPLADVEFATGGGHR